MFPVTITLDDITESVFQGTEGLEKALNVIKAFLEKSHFTADKATDLLVKYIRIKDKSKTIPSLFINRIKVNDKIKFYVRSGVQVGSKVPFPSDTANHIAKVAEEDCNKRILSTTESAVKRNREFEKNEIMKFFKENHGNIISFYELYNLLVDYKKDINS
jgi:hypothetical protein